MVSRYCCERLQDPHLLLYLFSQVLNLTYSISTEGAKQSSCLPTQCYGALRVRQNVQVGRPVVCSTCHEQSKPVGHHQARQLGPRNCGSCQGGQPALGHNKSRVILVLCAWHPPDCIDSSTEGLHASICEHHDVYTHSLWRCSSPAEGDLIAIHNLKQQLHPALPLQVRHVLIPGHRGAFSLEAP